MIAHRMEQFSTDLRPQDSSWEAAFVPYNDAIRIQLMALLLGREGQIAQPDVPSETVPVMTSDANSLSSWYAVYTSPRHEKRVAEHLESRAIESFLPLYRAVRQWKNRCRVQVEFPLFSNYVFVHIARPERIHVLQIPGVVSLVGTGREPSPIAAREIDLLRNRFHHLRNLAPHPYLSLGDRVLVTAGPLGGIEGILVRKKNELRLILTVEAIMKSFSIEVDADAVEPLGVARR